MSERTLPGTVYRLDFTLPNASTAVPLKDVSNLEPDGGSSAISVQPCGSSRSPGLRRRVHLRQRGDHRLPQPRRGLRQVPKPLSVRPLRFPRLSHDASLAGADRCLAS